MMKQKIINIWKSNKWIKYIGILVIGLFLGWIFFGHSTLTDMTMKPVKTTSSKKKIWTCSMHPQVREDHPGKCPICGMDLILLKQESKQNVDANSIQMSDEAIALANVEIAIVGNHSGSKEVRLFGKIQPNQRMQQSQSAYVGGRIERLFVNTVGDHITKGQTIAIIYSPELYTAEQELITALHFGDISQRKNLIDAAIEKLHLLNLTTKQINKILHDKKASPYSELKANTSGTVIVKNVSQGDYVNQGSILLQIADLSRLWAIFQAYEDDLPFIHKGESIRFTTDAIPGQVFSGRISFIDPILNNQTRTAGVRVELNNSRGKFKPEMLVSGIVYVSMGQYKHNIIVPKSAVLWTGKRSIVYVKDPYSSQPTFTMRNVVLGPSLPNSYVVKSGLSDGEEIVVNGTFAIDASAQLDGKHSMMNQ